MELYQDSRERSYLQKFTKTISQRKTLKDSFCLQRHRHSEHDFKPLFTDDRCECFPEHTFLCSWDMADRQEPDSVAQYIEQACNKPGSSKAGIFKNT